MNSLTPEVGDHVSRFSQWGALSGLTRTGAWLRGLWLGGEACLRVRVYEYE